MNESSTLVINWHITEACNYRCAYCYAKWKDTPSPRELIHGQTKTESLIDELYQFFTPGNSANPLWGQMRWRKLRLNFAGGEPLLRYRKLPHIICHARNVGFEISLITNASLLTDDTLAALAPNLSWLGIGIDSASSETNRAIGRTDCKGKKLDLRILAEALAGTRAAYPQLKLKLNTVVNKANATEDLTPVITCLAPDKWKVLRMLPMVTNALAISHDEFNDFVARHRQFAAILCPEDNQEMRDSYLMVDPHGRFFQNGQRTTGLGYIYSRPILETGAAAAFGDISFDPDQFCARYTLPLDGSAK